MKFNVGDKVVVTDLSGMLQWSDSKGVFAEYSDIRDIAFTVKSNDLKIPMRRIVRPSYDNQYYADLEIVNCFGSRYFTNSRFCQKFTEPVSFKEAYIDMIDNEGVYSLHADGGVGRYVTVSEDVWYSPEINTTETKRLSQKQFFDLIIDPAKKWYKVR